MSSNAPPFQDRVICLFSDELSNMDTGKSFSENKYPPTHANVYIGAKSIKQALDEGADIILAGRVAGPCLTLGVLAHHYNWDLDTDLDKMACGISIGHLLECGGQASGGNSYAEWPMDYKLSNLGYPIAEVSEDGTAVFTKLESQGGKMSRNTLREQLVYEIHDPANYLTPDVTVDLTEVQIDDIAENKVSFSGVIGKPRPEKLKLTIGLMEGYLSEQFFFMSWPYAYQKAVKMVEVKTQFQKEVSNLDDYVILVVVDAKKYQKTNLELIKYLVGEKKIPGVYVTLNRPYDIMQRTFQKNNIDSRLIIFIDAVTHTSGEAKKVKNCLYIGSPEKLFRTSPVH